MYFFEISISTISWDNGQQKVKFLWPKGKILLNFENEKKKIVKNQRIKGKNQKKIADLRSYPNQPSAEGLA